MDAFTHLRNGTQLAHAYILFGEEDTFERVKEFAQELAGGAGSPDALCVRYASLGVDQARELSLFASLKPLGERKYILISFGASTGEAQNALLKVVEEGVGHTVFFFVVPVGTALLPTLRSRCVVLADYHDAPERTAGEDFLTMSYAERLALIDELGKEDGKEGARLLVASLLTCFSDKREAQKLRDLLYADQCLKLSGSSIKSVLGHLALTL